MVSLIHHKDHAVKAAPAAAATNGSAQEGGSSGGDDAATRAAAAARAAGAAQAAQAAAAAQVAGSVAQHAAATGGHAPAVLQFDADASPEAKAAAARAAAGLPAAAPSAGTFAGSGTRPAPDAQGTGLASDIGGAKNVRATLSLADVDAASRAEGQLGDGQVAAGATRAGTHAVPGVAPDAVVGWDGVARRNTQGLDPPVDIHNTKPPPGMAAPGELTGAPVPTKAGEAPPAPASAPNGKAAAAPDAKKLEEIEEAEARAAHWESPLVGRYVSDAQLGYFWFNGAGLISAVLATYFFTRFGAGIPGLLIVIAFFTTYYNASMRRTRQRYRDDIGRELAKKKMMSEHESAEWINHFMSRFWLIYEPVLSATIISTVDSILVANCPGFLDSIRMTTFTLGTKAPKIEHVRTFPDTEEDVVMMDWKFSFTPNDTQDLTVRQAARKINPKVVLTVRVGRSFVGAGFPILLEDMSFVGNIRLRMKLMSNYPHVQTVDISFMEPPHFDYVLKPIGGNTLGFDIGNIPGLSNFIQEQVHANLGPMMYNPNVFTLNLEELLSGTPLDTACGVLQVTVFSARELKGVKFGGGAPDPYVALSIDNKEVVGKTRYQHSTSSPQFRESKFLLLNNLNGMLTLTAMDYNEHRPDSHLGTAAWELKQLEEQPEHENISTPVMLDGKERGSIQYALSYYPVIQPEKGPDGKALPLPETTSGVVRLTVHQAKELDKRGGILGDFHPKARVLLNGNRVKDSNAIKRTDSPIWEMNVEFLVTDRKKAVIGIEVLHDKDMAHDRDNPYLSVKLDDLLAAKAREQDWFPLTNSKRGRVRMSAQWKPVRMAGSMNSGSGYTPAIGVAKFWVHHAKDVKNVEAALGGKSDPYAQLKVRGQITDRSTVVNNDLNPVWNEILYSPVRSLKDKITLELMDYQQNGKDRTLGTVEVPLAELARETGDNAVPYAGTGRKLRRAKIALGRGLYKGEVEFEVEFLPGLHLKGVEFEGVGNEAANKAGTGTGTGDDPDEEAAEAGLAPDERRRLTAVTVTGGTSDEQSAAAHAQPQGQGQAQPLARNGSVVSKSDKVAKRLSKDSLASVKTAKDEGIEMSNEQLLKSQSGILVFNLLSGKIPRKNARLEVLFEDGYWPTYTTEPGRTENPTWDEVGEGVIKELDWSRMWLKLRHGKGDTDEDVFAEFQANTKDILERALNKPAEFRLHHLHGNGASTITMVCKYIPVDIKIEPVESVNNQGYLRVEVVNARNLRAADRGKSSDPYVVFKLNGERHGKTKTIKKTLNPEWNEDIGETPVPSRVAAEAILEVYDWDQVGTADHLGSAQLDLAALEPFEQTLVTLPVTGKGAGENNPTLTAKLVFKPDFVTHRERKGTSIARTMTSGIGGVAKVGGAGVKGVAGAGMFVGKTAFGLPKNAAHLVTHRGGRRKSVSADDAAMDESFEAADGVPPVPSMPAGYTADGLPLSSSGAAPAVPFKPTTPGASSGHHGFRMPSAASHSAASLAEEDGTESPSGKRKSRIHNPFKRH